MENNKEASTEKKESNNNETPFNCTGCGSPLGKFDENCPNCERLNPNYVLR
jgi:rubrerythrin